MSSDHLQDKFLKQAAPTLFRLVWLNHIDPARRASFREDFKSALSASIMRTFVESEGADISTAQRSFGTAFCGILIEKLLEASNTSLPAFHDTTFEQFTNGVVESRRRSVFSELFAIQLDEWTSRIAKLDQALISSLQTVNEEYILWLKTHPESLDKIHWRAFERLTAEVLASHGFAVRLTGHVKNRSSDIIAVETNALGIGTKYLVECKRHGRRNKVDLNIVNSVLGAKVRAGVDHAMLVTTSSFTQNVTKERAALADFRLHLADGEQFREWLGKYELSGDGLWLPDGWEMS